MIYTVTFNPAIDYVVHLEEVVTGMVNRSQSEEVYYGGKGINVSTILRELGVESKALGFIAGFTGLEIESVLKKLGIQTDFIHLEEGLSRINLKIKAQEETEINGQGPRIKEEDINKLFNQLDEVKDGDILVLAGSIPNTLPQNIYEKIMERLSGKNIKVVVDATQELLLNVLAYHPFLIKPNHHELSEIFNTQIQSDEEIIFYAKQLQEKGARNVLVSMAKEGAILITEEKGIHKLGVPKGVVKNSVGAGDSMIAGFIAGYLKEEDFLEALKLGTAAGSATAFSSGLATKAEIMKQFATL